MHHRTVLTRAVVTSVLVLGTGAALAAPAQAHPRPAPAGSAPVVVVSGLNNPRQLALGDDGLLIAEAGKGGPVESTGPDGPVFVGPSGSVSLVRRPDRAHDQAPNRIVTGLYSGSDQDGNFAVGSDGVSSRGEHGPVYIQETFLPPPAITTPEGTAQNGALLAASRHGVAVVADITGYENAHDPDGHGVESDPYAVLARHHDELVADAAGNDVLRVDRRGHISLFHVFPNVTTGACAGQNDPSPEFPGCNFVPTSLAQDRHGNVYVGGLSSLTPGEAQVVKLDRSGAHVRAVWGGFSGVSGLAVAGDGTVYVSELFGQEANPPVPQVQGLLTRISPDGTRTSMDVPFPAGIALAGHRDDDRAATGADDGGHHARGNTLYVSAWSVASDDGLAGPGTSGQVWRLRF